MRTISQTVEYFRLADPDTYINEWWLRSLLKRGEFPYHKAGKRFLINIDAFEGYLSEPPKRLEPQKDNNAIRSIARNKTW